MIQLSAVFSSHMVLQRQKNISVWGDSDAESLKITLADKSVSGSGTGKVPGYFTAI